MTELEEKAKAINELFLIVTGWPVKPEILSAWLDRLAPFRHDRVMEHIRRMSVQNIQFPRLGQLIKGMAEEINAQAESAIYLRERAKVLALRLAMERGEDCGEFLRVVHK